LPRCRSRCSAAPRAAPSRHAVTPYSELIRETPRRAQVRYADGAASPFMLCAASAMFAMRAAARSRRRAPSCRAAMSHAITLEREAQQMFRYLPLDVVFFLSRLCFASD